MDTFHPEVLVLDLRLPDTDGITLLQEIRQSQPSLPVIVTSSYVSLEPLINVLDLGHSGYRVKPFDLEDLAARIDALGGGAAALLENGARTSGGPRRRVLAPRGG